MTDSEVILQLREENEGQKVRIAAFLDTTKWLTVVLVASSLFYIFVAALAYWQGGRDARAHQCSACPVPACPVCAPVADACKDSVMEMKGVWGNGATTISCPHAEQKLEIGDHGWAICRCAKSKVSP
jgi:hypothetical protein